MSPGDPDRSRPRVATPPPWDMLRFVWRGRLAASLRCVLDAWLDQQLCGICPMYGILGGSPSSTCRLPWVRGWCADEVGCA